MTNKENVWHWNRLTVGQNKTLRWIIHWDKHTLNSYSSIYSLRAGGKKNSKGREFASFFTAIRLGINQMNQTKIDKKKGQSYTENNKRPGKMKIPNNATRTQQREAARRLLVPFITTTTTTEQEEEVGRWKGRENNSPWKIRGRRYVVKEAN